MHHSDPTNHNRPHIPGGNQTPTGFPRPNETDVDVRPWPLGSQQFRPKHVREFRSILDQTLRSPVAMTDDDLVHLLGEAVLAIAAVYGIPVAPSNGEHKAADVDGTLALDQESPGHGR